MAHCARRASDHEGASRILGAAVQFRHPPLEATTAPERLALGTCRGALSPTRCRPSRRSPPGAATASGRVTRAGTRRGPKTSAFIRREGARHSTRRPLARLAPEASSRPFHAITGRAAPDAAHRARRGLGPALVAPRTGSRRCEARRAVQWAVGALSVAATAGGRMARRDSAKRRCPRE